MKRGDAPAFPAARLDRPTRLLTLAVIVLALLGVPLLAAAGEGSGAVTGATLGAVAAVLLVGAWGFGPLRYELDGTTLRVHRRGWGSRAFRLTGAAGRVPAVLGLGVRLGGTGGVFGWAGPCWQARSGRYRAYMTDRARLVGCETDAGLVVVSPADPEAFLRAAREVRR